MPIYEYEREDGTRFEMIQRMGDDPLAVCPTTGQGVKRLISGAALHFRGSGFYITDYAKKNANGNGQSNGKGKADSSGTSEKTKESSSSDTKKPDSSKSSKAA